jgi:UDP-N-acetylglucosamine--N-acetylmuramyl-(pentapeptide) pyrophosphoryl-undecaprenol N-acetylglucosamine transferase
MAGGTGGHIFPGIAVAEYLRLEGWRIHWLGNPSGMEYELTQKYGFKFEAIEFSGVRGKGLAVKLQAPFRLLKAIWQSYQIMRRIKPNIVLGMGGYVGLPGGIVSSLCRVPLILHEQNSIAGMANKVLSQLANRVLCAFPNALPRSEWVGNPIRNDLLSISSPESRYVNRTGPMRLLVVGGSLGASILNEVIPKAIALLGADERPIILHQAGKKHVSDLQKNYDQYGLGSTGRSIY